MEGVLAMRARGRTQADVSSCRGGCCAVGVKSGGGGAWRSVHKGGTIRGAEQARGGCRAADALHGVVVEQLMHGGASAWNS